MLGTDILLRAPCWKSDCFFFDTNLHVHGIENQMPRLTRGYCVHLIAALELWFIYQDSQLLSHVWCFVTPWTAACQATLSISSSQSLLKLRSIESVMPTDHLILCCLHLLPPSIFPSIRVFSNDSLLCIGWPKYLRCSWNISPSNEYSGLIYFRIDWFDLQGSPKSLFQHHSSWRQFFRAQPSLWSNSHIHTWLLENQSFDSALENSTP